MWVGIVRKGNSLGVRLPISSRHFRLRALLISPAAAAVASQYCSSSTKLAAKSNKTKSF